MRVEFEEYPSTTPVGWTVTISDTVTCIFPTDVDVWTQSSEDCIQALNAASNWINFSCSEVEKWKWVVRNAPEWLTVEVVDESRA